MRKLLCLLLIMTFLPCLALAEKYDALPPLQEVVQKDVRTNYANNVARFITYPTTQNAAVNEQLALALEELAIWNEGYLPAVPQNAQEGARLYVGASITRTGQSWQSFLMLANVLDGRKQTRVDYATAVYDIATGEELLLPDLFCDEGAYAVIQAQARAQLAAYFPLLTADEALLEELTSREALENASFTLDTAFLNLHYRADELYPSRENTLMHIAIPYTALRSFMTEEALQQTDNSGYKLVALTYDDGPTRGHTLSLIRALRRGCANATFFIVGDRMASSHDLLCFTHDAGFLHASHNYHHLYGKENRGHVQQYRDDLIAELGTITGAPITMMRAPGGAENIFIEEDVGLPLLHWSFVAADQNTKDAYREANRLASNLKDGDILLSHDLYRQTAEVAEYLPQLLNSRGFLCVTVAELFAARGLALEANVVYSRAE